MVFLVFVTFSYVNQNVEINSIKNAEVKHTSPETSEDESDSSNKKDQKEAKHDDSKSNPDTDEHEKKRLGSIG